MMFSKAFLSKSTCALRYPNAFLARSIVTARGPLCNHEKVTSDLNKNLAEELSSVEKSAKTFDLTSIDQFRQDMKPFLKELFCGNFDDTVLSYPDVLTNDRYYNIEERLHNLKTLLDQKKELVNTIDNKVSKDLLLALRSQDFFGLRAPQYVGGERLSLTESLRLVEEVASANLSLANIIVNSSWYATEAIRRFASEEVKAKYLPGLYAGTSIAAICVADEEAGCDPNTTLTTVMPETSEGKLLINGNKLWVTNAPNADIFIVWAKQVDKGNDGILAPRLSVYLVDGKSSPGIMVEKEKRYPLRGMNACQVSTVTFKNASVPVENQLGPTGEGFDILTDCLKEEPKLASSVIILAGLRKALNETIAHASSRRAFGSDLKSFQLISNKIGVAGLHLFALESSIYMTAGIADYQKEPDFELEAAACKIYATTTLKTLRDICKSIKGAETYLQDSQFASIFDDLEGLTWWESTEDLNRLYLGLGGLAYSGAYRQEAVSTLRNSVANIFGTMKHVLKVSNEPKLKFKIHESVHPMLIEVAKHLEKLVLRFDRVIEYTLVQHGADVHLAETDVGRLANVATYLYATISAVARASRSYCDGHAHGDLEVKMCISYVAMMEPIILLDLEQAAKPVLQKVDAFVVSASDYMFDKGCYPLVHPMTKNMF